MKCPIGVVLLSLRGTIIIENDDLDYRKTFYATVYSVRAVRMKPYVTRAGSSRCRPSPLIEIQ
jgi:hypothetical protein